MPCLFSPITTTMIGIDNEKVRADEGVIVEGLYNQMGLVEKKFWQLWSILSASLDTVMEERYSQGFAGIVLSRSSLLRHQWGVIRPKLAASTKVPVLLQKNDMRTILNNRYILDWLGPAKSSCLTVHTPDKRIPFFRLSEVEDFSPELGIIFKEKELRLIPL